MYMYRYRYDLAPTVWSVLLTSATPSRSCYSGGEYFIDAYISIIRCIFMYIYMYRERDRYGYMFSRG